MTLGENKISGTFVKLGGEDMYQIDHFDQMPPFFMSLVSDSDLWAYISSTGCLSAGRNNPDKTLFPYYTVDRLHDNAPNTGPITMIDVDGTYWHPFSQDRIQSSNAQRRLMKSIYGDKVVFEEGNPNLHLKFQYSWSFSDKYGLIRRAVVKNEAQHTIKLRLLDGVQNVMPSSIARLQQMTLSNLMDAYKRTEVDMNSGLGLYYLNAIPVDRAEPSESLTSNVVWHLGLENATIHIDPTIIKSFMSNQTIQPVSEKRGGRGAYLLETDLELRPGEQASWTIAMDHGYDAGRIAALKHDLKEQDKLAISLKEDQVLGREGLIRLVGSADGIQMTRHQHTCVRHFYNVLFNIMRGGVFDDHYFIQKDSFLRHVRTFNNSLYDQFEENLESLPDRFTVFELHETIDQIADPNLLRIAYEYLPIIFSRRHGDPSRPWNIFDVNIKDASGNRVHHYEGNWRDIFQNWEALLYSYPGFVDHIITKFVNASTADGYNPYRISDNGIDWEELEPDNPWSYIGYWGDHQVIYLQKLLELSERFYPGKTKLLLKEAHFVHANVPYKIKGFQEIVDNPYSTIDYDEQLNHQLKINYDQIGADAYLYHGKKGLHLVNLAEKFLVSTLTKLYNLVPDAGIWLNTQRPEWNDANNALAGYGCSMVTVYYLHRQLSYYTTLFQGIEEIEISKEVAALLTAVKNAFESRESYLSVGLDPKQRWKLVNELGKAGETYRSAVYMGLSGKRTTVAEETLMGWLSTSLKFIAQSIHNNLREDNMYHAYNLISFEEDSVEVHHLYEMLEGQVAVLSANVLDANDVMSVMSSLRDSKMYHQEHHSFMLYPNRELPTFMLKNLPDQDRSRNIFDELTIDQDKTELIAYSDVDGNYRFAKDLRNAEKLKERLNELQVPQEKQQDILNLYESTFNHRYFTGRSGTFFGYEGLGCIYWHMVSKLQLALAENLVKIAQEADSTEITSLKKIYYEVKEGVGAGKTPDHYGAFPMEPYSHSTTGGGVKQPGMTGQVKEDILSRMLEFGIVVENGSIQLLPALLDTDQFQPDESIIEYYDITGAKKGINSLAGSMMLTFAQVPFVIVQSSGNKVEWYMRNGKPYEVEDSLMLPATISQEIFHRTGLIEKVVFYVGQDS